MANSNERKYIPTDSVRDMTRVLDNAREDLQIALEDNEVFIPAPICAGISRLREAVQWVIHQPPFLEFHQEYWKERFGKKGEQ
jgi:hypothetical protein